jgi:hypothetical protein
VARSPHWQSPLLFTALAAYCALNFSASAQPGVAAATSLGKIAPRRFTLNTQTGCVPSPPGTRARARLRRRTRTQTPTPTRARARLRAPKPRAKSRRDSTKRREWVRTRRQRVVGVPGVGPDAAPRCRRAPVGARATRTAAFGRPEDPRSPRTELFGESESRGSRRRTKLIPGVGAAMDAATKDPGAWPRLGSAPMRPLVGAPPSGYMPAVVVRAYT